MIDVELFRSQADRFRDSYKKRFISTDLVGAFLTLDERWRELTTRIGTLREERGRLSKDRVGFEHNQGRLSEIKTELEGLEAQEKTVAKEREHMLSALPNLLSDDVPTGEGESANTIVRKSDVTGATSGKPHEELMTQLGWLDLAAAAKTAGSRFRYLKGAAALAEVRLMNAAFEFAIAQGFNPVIPPAMARGEILERGGFFPEGQEDTFSVGDDLYLTGTSEYQLVALQQNQTFDVSALPLRLVGFSTCFRKEAGSYGQDVKGMFRMHQFDKVELISICAPEDSEREHQLLLDTQEQFVSRFNLPYQVVLIGSGDVEKKAVKRFDIECWFPGQQRYRETHSVSNCTDYQARSLGIRYRSATGEIALAHTLNGTLATERLLLSIIENAQTATGEVALPSPLG